MAIPRKQIGWGTDSNLLWGIWKALETLTKVASKNKPIEPVEPLLNKTFTFISPTTEDPFLVSEVSGSESYLTSISAISLAEEQIYYLAVYNGLGGPKAEPKLVFPIPTHTQGAGFVLPISNDGVGFKDGITAAIFTYVPGPPDPTAPGISKNEVFLNFTYK